MCHQQNLLSYKAKLLTKCLQTSDEDHCGQAGQTQNFRKSSAQVAQC
jgi:hypothetical protein